MRKLGPPTPYLTSSALGRPSRNSETVIQRAPICLMSLMFASATSGVWADVASVGRVTLCSRYGVLRLFQKPLNPRDLHVTAVGPVLPHNMKHGPFCLSESLQDFLDSGQGVKGASDTKRRTRQDKIFCMSTITRAYWSGAALTKTSEQQETGRI